MIAIKGLRQGLLIVFSATGNEPWLSRLRELENKLEANPGFFTGGAVAFDVKHMVLTDDDLLRSISLLQHHDVTLWAVVAQDEGTRARIRSHGLADTLVTAAPEAKRSAPVNGVGIGVAQDKADKQDRQDKEDAGATTTEAPQAEGTDGLLVRRRVRSGQVLRHPGHVVVIGDVNPGAQLIAGGDIIVWGKLQGSAHAGALGDTHAVICALEMSPSLVKIADAALMLRSDERRKRNRQGKAETAQLSDQQITFAPWT